MDVKLQGKRALVTGSRVRMIKPFAPQTIERVCGGSALTVDE